MADKINKKMNNQIILMIIFILIYLNFLFEN